MCSRVMCTGLAPASAPKFHEVGYLRGGAAVSARGDHVRPTAAAFRVIFYYVLLATEPGL